MRQRSSRTASFWLALAGSFAVLGCGAEFDRLSEIKSLRVLGIEKSSPYAQPGETVRFKLAFHDGSPAAVTDPARKVQVGWLGGCFNPPGDLYAGCFASERPFVPAFGNTFDLTIPEDIIVPRQAPMLPYGLTYLFFTVCAGELAIDTSGAPGLPLRCRDADGKDLGANDFVAGYTAVYVFGTDTRGDTYSNANPVISGFSVSGQELSLRTESTPGGNACLGDDCLADCSDPERGCVNAAPAEIDCSVEGAPCIPTCEDDGDLETCDPYSIKPLIDQSVGAEIDRVSLDVYGRSYQEQMWINYYTTRGALETDTRLLNDATKGWNAEYGTDFYAPKEPGPVRVWAVAHDNRGGMTWVGATLQIVPR